MSAAETKLESIGERIAREFDAGEPVQIPTQAMNRLAALVNATFAKAEWLIWSNELRAWWRANHRGYTVSREEAGRYTLAEAVAICEGANRATTTPYETIVKE